MSTLSGRLLKLHIICKCMHVWIVHTCHILSVLYYFSLIKISLWDKLFPVNFDSVMRINWYFQQLDRNTYIRYAILVLKCPIIIYNFIINSCSWCWLINSIFKFSTVLFSLWRVAFFDGCRKYFLFKCDVNFV